MLILTRHRGETIRIGDDIVVKVLKVRDSYILVGIEAPKGVKVLRQELVQRPRERAAEEAPGAGPQITTRQRRPPRF